MSWDSYVQDLTSATHDGVRFIESAAICGFKPPGVWAHSPGFNVTVAEIQALIESRSQFASCGPKIAGLKCMLLVDHMDMEEVYSMNLKTASDASGNKYNICVGKSLSALVIAKGELGDFGGLISKKVYTVVDYLRKSNV